MPDMTYGYKENEAGQLADEASNMARKAKESLADTAKTMKDKTQEFGRDAMNKIEENRVSAADALHTAMLPYTSRSRMTGKVTMLISMPGIKNMGYGF